MYLHDNPTLAMATVHRLAMILRRKEIAALLSEEELMFLAQVNNHLTIWLLQTTHVRADAVSPEAKKGK